MEIHGIFILCYLFLALEGGVDGFPMNDLITKLPGQPDVSFRQFAGYIDLDDDASGRSLFYYFVEAENNPKIQPLTIWLTGGSGCSSVGDAFSSVGPFITTKNAHGLDKNLFSWNKAKLLVTFMHKWYEAYPSFKTKFLYLAGSSYAGHYVPNLANALIDENIQSKRFKFNVRGIALGNPMLRRKLDILARYDFFRGLGLIDSAMYREAKKDCNTIDENNYFSKFDTNWTYTCQLFMDYTPFMFRNDAIDLGYSTSKLFDAIRDPCVVNFTKLILGNELTKVSRGVDMCAYIRPEFYFNLPEVQKAFHGNRTNMPYPWKGCQNVTVDKFKFNENDKNRDMLPVLKSLLQRSISIAIFSGDADGTVPATGTLRHLYKLAEEMNVNLTRQGTWRHENKRKGMKYSFGDLLTFFTVKEGDHHVTFSK